MDKYNFKYLTVAIDDSLATIWLNRPPHNSMNIPMMKEISLAHKELEDRDDVRAILLGSAVDGFFSNGLDIDDLIAADSNQKLEIFENLYNMCHTIYSTKKIHVAWLNGHAMAGGAVCAAMSDFRFFSNGQFRAGFTEAKIGLGIPGVFLKIIESIVGVQNLRNSALLANAFKPDEALQIGLVDDVFNPDEALSKIHKFISLALRLPDQSYKSIKAAMRAETIQMFSREKELSLNLIKNFFNENFTEGLLSLKEKRKPHFKT